MFSAPAKILTDVEYKGRFGALVRAKFWYDYALENNEVRVGSQANNYNGVRPGLGPVPGFLPCTGDRTSRTACRCRRRGRTSGLRRSSATRASRTSRSSPTRTCSTPTSGSFAVRDSDVQVRLGNQVINWGESIFIQGVNQINPIDVPAARRAGAELKEILLPVWAAYANWGFNWGSVEAFYQLEWNNTSVDACGTYFSVTSTQIGADPGSCESIPWSAPSTAPRAGHGFAPRPAARLAAVAGGRVRRVRPFDPRPRGRRHGPARHLVPHSNRCDRHRTRPVRDEHPLAPAGFGELLGHEPERPAGPGVCRGRVLEHRAGG